MNLRHLTDQSLLIDTKNLAKGERDLSLKVLHHLKEIERRRLFSDLRYSSLFEYAVKELGYSEPEAARRIKSARLLDEIPEIEQKIEEGVLNLTNVAMAGQLFKNEEIIDVEVKKEIMKEIENKTKRECETILLKYVEVPSLPREIIKPVMVEFQMVRMNLSNDTVKILDELKAITAHQRLSTDELMQKTFKLAVLEFKTKKFKLNAKFTTPVESPCETRYISSQIKKEVYLRDKGKCQNCKSDYKLEYDHILPFNQGGKSTLSNLRLLCFSCNQRRLKKH